MLLCSKAWWVLVISNRRKIYDFQRENREDFKTVIEWNLVELAKRLRKIQSGQGYDAGIQNLKIYKKETQEENTGKTKSKINFGGE